MAQPQDAHQMLAEARRLVGEGRMADAKAGLVVAGCLFPGDAELRFEHWKLCCIAGEEQVSARILRKVCEGKTLTEPFCKLLLGELCASAGDALAVARAGCLECCHEILTGCLELLPGEVGGGFTSDQIWSCLLRLASMSADWSTVWWRAAEFAHRLDAEEGAGRLCTHWSSLLAGKCLVVLLDRLSVGSGLDAAQVMRLIPLVERAILHHMGAGQWSKMRWLLESFISACPPGLPDVGSKVGASRCRSHAVALSVAHMLVASEKLEEHVVAAGHVALLGSFMEAMYLYARTCCPQDTPGASGPPAEDENEGVSAGKGVDEFGGDLGGGDIVDGVGIHGWFLLQIPKLVHGEGAALEPPSKRARGEGDGDKQVQAVLARQLSGLAKLWEGMQNNKVLAIAGKLCGRDAVWADSSWVWHSCLADLHWFMGDYALAAARLRKMEGTPDLPHMEHARCRLQLAVCELLGGACGSKEAGRSVRGLLCEFLSAGGAQLRWFVPGRITADPCLGSAEHVHTTWGEIVVQSVMMLVHVGQLDCGQALVLSQAHQKLLLTLFPPDYLQLMRCNQNLPNSSVSWPRLGRYCLECIRREDFSLENVVKGKLLTHIYNVDILERLLAVPAGKENNLRQALEKRMGQLGGDPPCLVATVMREALT